MSTKKILFVSAVAIGLLWAWGGTANALKAPHNATKGISCSSCHLPKSKFRTLTSYDTLCYNAVNGCHLSGGSASKKKLSQLDASNRFGSLPAIAGRKQSSHGWKIPTEKLEAGASNWNPGQPYKVLNDRIFCSRCHMAHGEVKNRSFLNASPDGDAICLNCHAPRDIDSARSDKQAAVIAGSKHYSHPVQVGYSAAKYRKSQERDSEGAYLKWEDWYEASPTNEPGWNESARPRLYTTFNFDIYGNRGGVKGEKQVICSTCHGPLHSADSNPYTFDNLSAYSRFGQVSTTAGNLLRRYPMSNTTWGDKTCTACHKVKTHQGYQCNRCHEPHKRKGDTNIYLIRTSIQTPYAKQSVYFTSTSQMAKRWGIYSSPNSSRSTAICQVCHRTKGHHRAYSTVGADREHKYNAGTGKYMNCIQCHPHNASAGAFAQVGGCDTCHKAPPDDAYGKHGKHVGNAGYKWRPVPVTIAGQLDESRNASDYGFSCGRCHNPLAPYTASTAGSNTGQNHYGTAPGTLKGYTADIGFGQGNHPLPTNGSAGSTADYQLGTRGTSETGGSPTDNYRFSTPASGSGTCRNLYCHGQFYGGYTSNNPDWLNTGNPQTCGKCHGAKRSDPPGKTAGTNWGAHQRHVGNADNQQYNFSGWKFGCNVCHYPTTWNSVTSIDDRSTHVDGRVNIEFNGGGYGDLNSRYDGFVDYTSRKPKFTSPFSNSKPAYKTCGLIYCHSDGSRMSNYSAPFNAGVGTGTARYPNWSSAGKAHWVNSRCSKCHGNSTYVGITAAMPGVTSKGNSHVKHVIDNGFLCNVCHDDTVNSDNKSIKSTTLHVNKAWDIKILSQYEISPGASYSAGICNNVNCHGGKATPKWGNQALCQNCHMNTTGDVDKRIQPRSKFSIWTGAVPMIYSTQWADQGHGRQSGSYVGFNTNNAGANKICTDCHGDGTARAGGLSTKHGTANNPFRLYTAPDRPNILCERCHGTGGSATNSNGVFTHASSVTAAGHNYAVKCIDCHDPHGDNNIFMLHSTLPRPLNTARDVASGRYGIITSNANQVNVDFSYNQYTSDYARKTAASKVCQVCHDETKNPSTSQSRFRYYSSLEKGHGSGRCTDCHQHSAGFKGAGCDGCHGAPPTGTFNLISGSGRINNTKKRSSGNITVFGPHSTHVTVIKATDANMSKYEACSACHYSGMWESGQESFDIEMEFRAFTNYSGTTQEFNSGLGTKSGFYGLSGIGVGTATSDNRCVSMKCHGGGWLTSSLNNISTPIWGNSSKVKCGNCHGAKKAAGSGSWPTSKAHARHAGTGSAEYNLMCKLCHNQTVLGTATTLNKGVHVNAQANISFDTADLRVSGSTTYSGDTNVNSGFGKCATIYCHSRGTDFNTPYTYANYTADWTETLAGKFTNTGERCSYCHGSKGAGGYKGITSAMPNYPNLSPKINGHKKHVVDNGFSCYACHAATVDSTGRAIADKANHLNRVYDVSFPSKYDLGGAAYSANKCTNIKCHGGRTTPAWGGGVAANCQDCHYASSGAASAEDSFTWENMSGTAAKIYSTEWTKRGHGRSSGNYPFSPNAYAGKNCANCHDSGVSHNTGGNYFRLTNSNPETLCLSCHGSGAQLTGAYGNATGIQSHSWANVSTAGYKTGNTDGKAGWNFPNQTAKCVDCHDPHGDKNDYMMHSFVNMSGSDSQGRPLVPYAQDSVLMNFTAAKNGTQVAWSSFVKSDRSGICQRCHSAEVANFDKGASGFTAHNAGTRCTDCHKHKKAFAPSGCDSCHGDSTRTVSESKPAPPKGPSTFGWTSDDPGNQATWGIHRPHAFNPMDRPGLPAQTGFACSICHGNGDGRSEGAHPGSTNNAGMNNMTSAPSKRSKWAPGADGKTSVIDDTCWNTGCHTPRAYTRTWKKPVDCDDCHGFQQKTATVYATHTTQSHKIHVRYTSSVGYKKKYGFACTNCHYNWVTNNNYSTHYNSFVNITANGPVNTIGANFYTKGRSFKGFTTGNESLGTCSNTYCHGNFTGGVNGTPNWKKGVTTVNCASCHRSAYVDATGMPGKHPKHASTSKGGYQFACVRCHSWTTNNITTVLFNRTSHVNTRKDVNFNTQPVDQTAGTYPDGATSKRCENIYCHSKGTSSSTPFTGAVYSNFTAKWGDTVGGYKVAAGSKGRCNYCHGNDTWTGTTSAMPNYVSGTLMNGVAKANRHDKHVRTYSFVCNVCHYKVTNNNTSIEVSGGRALHVNGSFNVNFRQGVDSKAYINNTGIYTYITGTPGSKCKNTYCHSMGTDWTKPYSTRTSFSNFTARWGDTLGSYKQTRGLKAKCNYCHGSRAYSGQTSAMPNYSTEKGKANSHRAHVIGNGYMCNICHYGVVRNNTSISDAARHADRFYNISLAPGYRGAAGKTYSTSWSPQVGGTCMNNTCHGSSKPKWGVPSTASCKSCHFTTNATEREDDYGRFNSVAAKIYSTDWGKKGHGAWNRTCNNCHDSNVAHNFAQTPLSNPFRLYTSDPNALCQACHGNTTERADNWGGGLPDASTGINIKTHNKADATGGIAASWNNFQNNKVKCVDCHDPHGDKNKRMIQSFINHTGSDRFGRPTRADFSTVSSAYSAQMTFTSFGGNINWSSFANANVNNSICRRCHTPNLPDTGMGDQANALMTKTQYAGGSQHQASHQACTGCHDHKAGFKGGGVSPGGQACEGCHNIKSLMMNNQNGYHHVLMNVSAVYRNVTLFDGTAGGLNNKARRCLMCHVDHDKFNGSKAKNLRESASDSGANGMNSDFWPAKRKNVVRTGADAGTANYSSTYPVKGTTGTFGVCISCHKNVQYKNTTMQKDLDNTSRTRDFSVGLYTSSSHNFQVVSSFIRFDDGTKFRANCTKCHNTDQMDKGAQSGGRYQMALHEQNTQSLLNNGTSSSKPKIEDICYKCHSNDSRQSGGPGTTHDYYSSVKMSSGAKLLKTAIVAKSSGHPIDDPDMAGLHKADEFFKLPNSYNYTRTGGVQGGSGSGWNRGSNRHVECTDCHNTHGGNASVVRQEGTAAGNLVAGAQKGAWGVKVKYPPFKTPGNTIQASDQAQPTYSTVRQSTYQFDLCMKCHSAYAYYTAYPVTPSGTVARSTGVVGDWDYSAPQTDVGMDFHPNAHGYHPVVRAGRNQPPHNANANWPTTGTRRYIASDGSTKFQGVSGLGWTFVPPYSQKSTLACSDCHKADNTGNAIGRADAFSIVAQGGWLMPNGIADVSGYNDGKVATPIDSAVLNVYVKAASSQSNLQYGEAVIYGKSSSGTTNNRKVTVTAWKGGVQDTAIGAWAITFSKSNTRYTKKLGTPTAPTWADLTAGNVWDVRVNKVNTSEPSFMTVDYLGIAAIYKASGDIRGPHGSLQKWILADLDRKVRFDADNNGTIGNIQWDALNSQWPTQRGSNNYAADADILNMFCFNCHRRDVYEGTVGDTFVGTPAATIPRGKYSRIVHPLDGPAGDMANNNYGSNKIWCQNCHGGRVYEVTGATARTDLTVRQNEVHGSFANMTVYSNSDGAFVAKLSRPKGVRLIHGAVIAGIEVPTSYTGPNTTGFYTGDLTCYTVTVADSMGACTSHATGRTTTVSFNYTYTSW